MLQLTAIQQISVWVLPVLFAVTLHEAAHGYVAYRLGDPTAKLLGRLSFNPIKHIDFIGSIVIPLVVLILSDFNFVFGYAKPVPINPANFSNPRRDVALTTAAGPGANLLMAFFWAACFKIGAMLNPQTSMLALFIVLTGQAGIIINLLLAFLNLVPIPPLDGSKIVASFLSHNHALIYQKIEPFGFLILILLLITGVLNLLIAPFINIALSFISLIFNL